MTTCECGCGQVVKPGNRFIKGHANKSKPMSDEQKQKISLAHGGNGIIKTHKSMYENKDCATYLGIVVGERLCKHLFNDVEMMSYGHSGYDLICNKGMKIDVKTAVVTLNNGKNQHWQFTISKNKIADYFILVAIDNRTDLNLIHQWLIPGEVINNKMKIAVYLNTVHKWSQWEKNINDAQLCCTAMKSDRHYVHLKEE